MYSPFKMKGKSPMMKALIGKQNNLPEQLKAKIKAAPESPAKMAKKSPTKRLDTKSKKVNPFSAEYKRMTVSQRRKKYNTVYDGEQYKEIDDFEKIGSGKKGTIKTALDRVSKVISPKKEDGTPQQKKITTKERKIKLENTTRSKKTKGGPNTTTPDLNEFKAVTFKGKKGDPYSYRTTKGGGYEYSEDGTTFTKASKKGNEAISKIAPTKMKKKSSMKMMKKK